MLAASRPARLLVLPMKPVLSMFPDPVLELLVTAAVLGAASLSRLGECLFRTVRAAWPSLTGNTASATLTVSSSPIVSDAVTAYRLPLAGVTITHHADTTATQSGTTATDSNGSYYFIVTAGWSGMTTQSLTGYNFIPFNNWILAVATAATQNFTAVITPPELVTATTFGSASTTIASGGARCLLWHGGQSCDHR